MPRTIIQLADRYLEWSSISDGPASEAMTREQFIDYYRVMYGAAAMGELAARLVRVDAKGTSSYDDENVDDTIWLNRAGPGDTRLSKAEIIRWYVTLQKEPTAEELMQHRRHLPKCEPCVAGSGQRCICWGTGVRE